MLTQRDAREIALKLSAPITPGRNHDRVVIRSTDDKLLGSYGIRRGSRQLSHAYIPKQINVTMRQALALAKCPMSRDEYFELMREKGHI